MKRFLLLLGLIIVAVVVAAVLLSKNGSKEGFAGSTDPNAMCPTLAKRDADGIIRVTPGDKKFGTMSEYVGYLGNLYAAGATCLAPKVENARNPVFGVFGGQGTDTIPPSAVNLEDTTRAVLDTSGAEETSVKTRVDKLDDYEYDRINQSEREGRNSISKAMKNELLEGRKLDWANLPFNSEERARQADEFIAGRMDDMYRDPKTGVFFKNMEGKTILPPDQEAEKMREAKILSAYKPTDLTQHTIDNRTAAVAKLVHDVYASDKNWEPVVTQVDKNKWEVTELRPKPRKETYEDAQVMSLAMAEEKGITQPPVQIDIMDRLQDDPYFDKRGVGDRDNNKFWNYKDFNKWTPGLERMFAPTFDNREWY